jgi:hypothetical protein
MTSQHCRKLLNVDGLANKFAKKKVPVGQTHDVLLGDSGQSWGAYTVLCPHLLARLRKEVGSSCLALTYQSLLYTHDVAVPQVLQLSRRNRRNPCIHQLDIE